jgi:hypothetical protein
MGIFFSQKAEEIRSRNYMSEEDKAKLPLIDDLVKEKVTEHIQETLQEINEMFIFTPGKLPDPISSAMDIIDEKQINTELQDRAITILRKAFQQAFTLNNTIKENITEDGKPFSHDYITEIKTNIMNDYEKTVSPIPNAKLQGIIITALAGVLIPKEHPAFQVLMGFKGKPIIHLQKLNRGNPIIIQYDEGVQLAYPETAMWNEAGLALERENLRKKNPTIYTSRTRFHQFNYNYLELCYRSTKEYDRDSINTSTRVRDTFNVYHLVIP